MGNDQLKKPMEIIPLAIIACIFLLASSGIAGEAHYHHLENNQIVVFGGTNDTDEDHHANEELLSTPSFTAEEEESHEEFIKEFGKTYASKEEAEKRKAIFIENYRKVVEINKLFEEGIVSYNMAVYAHFDLTEEEFAKAIDCEGPWTFEDETRESFSSKSERITKSRDAPESWNWVTQGGVTPVKNQVK